MNSKNIYLAKGLLFDLDGTLVNSLKDLACSANATRLHFGLSPLPEEKMVTFIGQGMKNLVFQALNQNEKLLEEGIQFFRTHYEKHCLDHTRPYPGVPETLAFFHEKIPMAVVTNKPYSFSKKILDHFCLSPFFLTLVGGDTCDTKKPHPEPILMALKKMDLSPSPEIILVGDSEADILGAQNAHILSCAVTYGLRKKEYLEKFSPHLLIQSFSELTQIIQPEL
ncbi:MAG: HAD family hydrolase [Planctomycetota bacterium]|nr:MAG: HAD family hydrolase [Planctomycetota bacterium]